MQQLMAPKAGHRAAPDQHSQQQRRGAVARGRTCTRIRLICLSCMLLLLLPPQVPPLQQKLEGVGEHARKAQPS